MSNRVRWTGEVVLAANAALLVLQLVAGRLLAPFIGSSLETWTAVIGVILAGICAGNAAGGALADRRATQATLRGVLALGGLATLATLGLVMGLDGSTCLRPLPLYPRIALLAGLTCFPPAFVLSLLTPLAIRLVLPDVRHTGSVVGRIYALGTLGSLLGNFVTGYVLVAQLSTYTIVGAVAAWLFLLAVLTPSDPGSAAETAGLEAAPRDAPGPADPMTVPAACAVTFLASFCSMGLELAASRLAAPNLGVSLYTWTGIIGVVLCGLSLGNWLGGRIADRWPGRGALALSLFAGGVATWLVLPGWRWLSGAAWLREIHLIGRTLLWSALLYLPAMIALGTISPQATRLAVVEMSHAGRVSGRIYAWSCAGAILGTFATGWLLIRSLGVLQVVFGAAVVLLVLAPVVARAWRRPAWLAASAALVLAVLGALGPRELVRSPYALETNYFAIRVLESRLERGDTRRVLQLDMLVHSQLQGREVLERGRPVWRADPSYLGYSHEQVQAELAVAAAGAAAGARPARRPRFLVVGGGGYTLPRWVDAFLPEALCEVVEIDPGVTEVCHTHLGLPRDTRIVSHHLDGRQFVQELAQPGSYDLVMQDAVNDLAVPFHIMTRQYNEAVRRLLRPDGVYLLTVIDEWAQGRLYRAALTTLRETFPHVHVLGASRTWDSERRSVMVIYGAAQPLDLARLSRALAARGRPPPLTVVQPAEVTRALLSELPPIVLTDTFAPVENLIVVPFRKEEAP